MKVGGKNGLTRNQFRTLIANLAVVAKELKESKQEHDRMEKDFIEMEDKNVKQWYLFNSPLWYTCKDVW